MPMRKKNWVLDSVQQVRKKSSNQTSQDIGRRVTLPPPKHHNPENKRRDMSHALNAKILLQPQTRLDISAPAEPDGKRAHPQQEGES